MIDSKHIERREPRPEYRLKGKRLGRHVLHDRRSRDFPAEMAAALRSVKHASVGLPLDQGQLGSCTANALCGALDSQPNSTLQPSSKIYAESDAVELYKRETALEGQPYPPNDPGGTGLMVCRAAKQLGWVGAYRHAFGLDHALRALVLRPVIFGVNWYSSFDRPDPQTGVVSLPARASVRGGHEIVADEIDATNQLVGFWNSWGSGWGLAGRFYMPFAVLGRLLQEQGDATVPYLPHHA